MICEYKKIYTGMLFWVLGLMLSMTLYPGDLKYVPTNYKHGMEVSYSVKELLRDWTEKRAHYSNNSLRISLTE